MRRPQSSKIDARIDWRHDLPDRLQYVIRNGITTPAFAPFRADSHGMVCNFKQTVRFAFQRGLTESS